MAKKNDSNHIDQLFKEGFAEPPFDIPQEWNTPSGAVWDNVANSLPTKKRRRYAWAWLFLLFIPLTYFIHFSTRSSSSTKEIEGTASTLENQIKSNIQSIPFQQIKESTSNTNQTITNQPQIPSNYNFAQKKENLSGINRLPRQIFATNQNNNHTQKDIFQQATSEFHNDKEQNNSSSQMIIPYLSAIAKHSTQTLSTIPTLKTQQPLVYTKTNSTSNVKKPITYGITVGILDPQLRVNSSYQNTFAPFDFYTSDQTSFQLGSFVTIPITRSIQLETGLNYRQQHINAGHNTLVEYNTQNEEYIGDTPINTYQTSFASALGLVDANMVLARHSQTLPYQPLTVDIGMNQSLHQLTLPIKPTVKITETNHTEISIAGNIQFNHLIKQTNTLSTINTNHSSFQNHNSELSSESNTINHTTIEQGISLEIASNDLFPSRVAVEPFVTLGASPIFKSDTFESKTKAYGINVKINIK